MRTSLLALAATIAASGCAARQPTDTLDEALEEASRAMQHKDAALLYSLLDEKLKVGVNEESLSRDLDRNEAEYEELAALLASPAKVQFLAQVKTKQGEKLDLVLEGETWKLDTPIRTQESTTDPVQALKRLADKLRSLRTHLLESGLLAEQHEKGFLALLDKLASEIDQIKPEDLVLAEDRCYLNLPSGRKIELVREEDGWKVYSIFPAIEFR
jgi:hypothetical protein